MSEYIDFALDEHVTVIGATRQGKTFLVEKSIERVKQGVFFFNVQNIEFSKDFVVCTGKDDPVMLVKALRKGEKINFIPTRETRWNQLAQIINYLFLAAEKSKLDIFIVVDEVHLAETAALKRCREIATSGISWGIKGVFISQRPALIDNTLMTQSMKFIILKTSMEKKYLEDYGFPYDAISAGLTAGGKYSYMVWDFDVLKGAFKV